MRWALPVLPFCLLAASCGGTGSSASDEARAQMNEEQLSQAEQRAPDPEKVMRERWSAMFAQPEATRAAAKEFGFQLTPDKSQAEQVLPKADAPIAVAAAMVVTGKAPERLDSIRFSFDVAYNRPAQTKAERDVEKIPVNVIRGFLNRFQVGLPDPLLASVMAGGTQSTALHGVAVQIAADPLPASATGAKRHIEITFTHEPSPAAAGMKS